MDTPFFSIVLPIYGVEAYLDRCIDSIRTQNFQDYEIILVDDESPDRCPEMCDEWAKKDNRIKVIHKKNAGLGMARNTGLDHASGQYIFFIDSDDYILPGLLKHCYSIIQTYHCDGIFYGFHRVNDAGELIQDLTPNVEPRLYTKHNDHIDSYLLADFFGRNPHTGEAKQLRISACNCCLSLHLLRDNQIRFVSEREYISEDAYFYLSLFKYIDSLYLLNKAYYCYVQNQGSLTFTYKPDRYERQRKFYIDSMKLAKREGFSPVVMERLSVPFLSNVISALKMEVGMISENGWNSVYQKIKSICDDPLLRKVIKRYPKKQLPRAWKVLFFMISKRKYRILCLLLYVKYRTKGV